MGIFSWIKLSRSSGSMWENLVWLHWSCQFLCDGLSSVNPKWFHYSYAVYVMEGLPFPWDLSQESSANYDLSFWLALLHRMSYFFFLYQPPLLSLYMAFFNSISSNINEVLSISPSANNETGHQDVSLTESLWKLRQRHDQNFQMEGKPL